MAYIETGNDFPGVVSLILYDRGTGSRLSALAHEVLRRPSTLTVGERELLAAYVSSLNDCEFCTTAHRTCAVEFLGEKAVEDWMLYQRAPSPKMGALLHLASLVQKSGKLVMLEDIQDAREQGATDQEIHDTVLIAALFCLFNRYVDGLGTTFKAIDEVVDDGQMLARYGYRMSLKRLFGQVLPTLWRKWRAR